jgi:molecular chaperone GrpE
MMSRKKKHDENQEQETNVNENDKTGDKQGESGISPTDNDAGQKTGGQKTEAEQKQQDELIQLTDAKKKLEEEVASLKDQLLRKHAELENSRKRLFKERDEAVKYANQMLLLDLTVIIDDFERAMKSADESKNFDVFHSGVVMIEKQLVTLLEKKWGLKRFDSVGQTFDPEKHQAISMEDKPDHDCSMVLEDYQRGYLYNDRVLRPAKVKVSQPGSASANPDINENKNANDTVK